MTRGQIRVGIGGWTFEPWRGVFYPPGLPHARELEHAASRVTAIEINATFYRLMKPASFAQWAAATPPGFVFSLKASRYCVTRKLLAEAGPSVATFIGQGLTELGPKLGPILWQLAPTRRFDPDDIAAFLALLPRSHDGLTLRHAIEVRHPSFCDPELVRLASASGVAIVLADSDTHPMIADPTADFVYARLQRAREELETGYPAVELDHWAESARAWSRGGRPPGPAYLSEAAPAKTPRDVLVFMINGAKVRAPAAAMALIGRVAG